MAKKEKIEEPPEQAPVGVLAICMNCVFKHDIDDPNEAINECHRFPPVAYNIGLGLYPRVKDNALGCGEFKPKAGA